MQAVPGTDGDAVGGDLNRYCRTKVRFVHICAHPAAERSAGGQ
jgi:hypothetical protein